MSTYGFHVHVRRLHTHAWLIAAVGLLVALVSALLVGDARSASQGSELIAFTRADGIYVMRSDGTVTRRIMQTEPIYGHGVAWSPDGTKLAIATSTGIWLTDANGRNPVRLVTGGGQPYWIGEKPHRKLFAPRATNFGSPTWSPDGRSIAFTAFQGVENRDIWVMNADGSDQHRLTKTPFFEGNVDWSPVGGWLAFDSGGWVSDVYVMKTNGTGLHQLTPGGGWVGSGQPAWSPDGQKIAFARPSGIWVMNARGRNVQWLTKGSDPEWSPDGRRIAFVRSEEIYAMKADGTAVTRLTHNRVADGNPAWQPVVVS